MLRLVVINKKKINFDDITHVKYIGAKVQTGRKDICIHLSVADMFALLIG